MTNDFKADNYSLNAQRFIYPLFNKDELGGFSFSSTMTFVKYKGEFFCIFAAHALSPNETSIDNIGALKVDGSFMALSDITKSFTIFRDHDLVVCKKTGMIEQKNYFELDDSSTTEFKEDAFGWIGFPKKKVKDKYHKTRSSAEHVTRDLTELDNGLIKWTNCKFLLVIFEKLPSSENEVVGYFDNKNVTYAQDGFKEQAYSFKGMSGGPLFHGPQTINTKIPQLKDLYKFAGIGLEHHIKDKKVKGVSKEVIIPLIESLL